MPGNQRLVATRMINPLKQPSMSAPPRRKETNIDLFIKGLWLPSPSPHPRSL